MSVGMAAPRSAYACDPDRSRGRQFAEPPSRTRSPFRRDCDRVIHSTAFRRLKHKTQVFVFHEGDHYRTRLTHSLEVAQIARALARQLGLDEDLTETLALAHDLGHPPFGHAGERALDDCLKAHGGFDHNAQTLRVVTSLEHRYPDFDGLNLTWESLEGIVKHNGPLTARSGAPMGRQAKRGLAKEITEYCARQDLCLGQFPSAEAQAGAIADDIAYDAHDIDDGLRAGMFSIDDLREIPLLRDILAGIAERHPRIEAPRQIHELGRRLITRMIEDVIERSEALIAGCRPACADDIRRCGAAVVAFSPAMAAADRTIKSFLFPRMYRHPRIMCIMGEAEAVVRALFERYQRDPDELPWRRLREAPDTPVSARQIADFIAGMTDRYALSEHMRLFDSTPELR